MKPTRTAKRTQTADTTALGADAHLADVARSHRALDLWLTSDHPLITALTENLAFAYEHTLVPRKQKMRAADRDNLKAILRCVIANLARVSAEGCTPPQVGVVLRTTKQARSRYSRPGFNGLPKVLAEISMARGGFTLRASGQLVRGKWVRDKKGQETWKRDESGEPRWLSGKHGVASALVADDALAETLARFRFRADDFRHEAGRETIWLTQVTRRDYVADEVERETINYADTDATQRYRAELVEINDALRSADMHMLPDGGPVVLTGLRELRRQFVLPQGAVPREEVFAYSGRLWGGWWETLERSRRKNIRLSGEPVVEVDFASMLLRLAYLDAGLTPPAGDLYANVPGFAGWREGVKVVTLSLLFRTTPMQRLPKGAKDKLPEGTKAASVCAAIRAAHPALAEAFSSGPGLRLFLLESQILVAAMLRLIRSGGPVALPLHDCLICPKSAADVVRQAMEDAAEEVAGFRLPTSLK